MEHGSHLMKLVAAYHPASSAGNRRLPSATSATLVAKQNKCRFHRVCDRRPRYTRNDGDCNYLVQYAFGQTVRQVDDEIRLPPSTFATPSRTRRRFFERRNGSRANVPRSYQTITPAMERPSTSTNARRSKQLARSHKLHIRCRSDLWTCTSNPMAAATVRELPSRDHRAEIGLTDSGTCRRRSSTR